MKRALLLVTLTAMGLALLVWLGGGIAGKGAREPEPEITDAPESPASSETLSPDPRWPVGITEGRGFAGPAEAKTITFTDPTSGETVVVPDFMPWFFAADRITPATARRAGEQAARAEGVTIVTYREPQTLEEARALNRNAHTVREEMVKWRVEAPWARADFLVGDLSGGSADTRPERADTRILLGGGVRIVDVEEDMEIEADSIEVLPYVDQAHGTGHVVVQHTAFELTGDGIDVKRKPHGTHLTITENAFVQFYGDVHGPDGKPLFDFGDHEVRPGRIDAQGGAVLVHEDRPDAPREDLRLDLTRRVHVEQKGGRSLDTERLRVFAFRDRPENGPAAGTSGWTLRKLDASGGVSIEYPGLTKRREPYLISASCEHLLHEVGPDGLPVTLLEGAPELRLRGNIPFGGLQSVGRPGLLIATAKDQMLLRPVAASEVPPDADHRLYRRAHLVGNAKVVYREVGLNPLEDTLEGEEMSVLLRESPTMEPVDEEETRSAEEVALAPGQVMAVSFEVLGEVRLGGTRMTGMTHRLLGRELDTNHPVLIAEGEGTSFRFHGLGKGERLLGGKEREQPEAAGGPGVRASGLDAAPPEPEWLLHRLHARKDVEIQTSLRGPSVGLPTRLEGAELTYDRVGDRARMRGAAEAPARLTVDTGGKERHRLVARSMSLDRGRGVVTADGDVKGIVYVFDDRNGTGPGSALALPEGRPGVPTTLGLATNGRIVIRTRIDRTEWSPRDNAEQVIVVEGDLVAELTASTLEVDSLRAQWLEVALVHALPVTQDQPTASTARIAGPGSTSAGATPARRDRPTAENGNQPTTPPTRWDLSAEKLEARFGAKGFESLDAEQRVTFASEEAVIRGSSFTFDAIARRAYVRGSPKGAAQAVFGPQSARNEVYAAEFVVSVDKDGPSRLKARGPARATLIRLDEKTPGALQRFDLACRGDVDITATRLLTEYVSGGAGPAGIEIRRWLRPRAGADWESPFLLWADRLVVHGEDLLSGAAANVERVVASGDRTTLRMGQGTNLTTVWGDRFDLDVQTSVATLESRPGRDLRVKRGPNATPRIESDQTRIVIDLNTGTIDDWDPFNFVLRGGVGEGDGK